MCYCSIVRSLGFDAKMGTIYTLVFLFYKQYAHLQLMLSILKIFCSNWAEKVKKVSSRFLDFSFLSASLFKYFLFIVFCEGVDLYFH